METEQDIDVQEFDEDEADDLLSSVRIAISEQARTDRPREHSILSMRKVWRAYRNLDGRRSFESFRERLYTTGRTTPSKSTRPMDAAVEFVFELLLQERDKGHAGTVLVRSTGKPFQGRHGVKCAISTGCRCNVCSEKMEQYLFIKQHVMVEGNTLHSAGEALGITRERVRQIIKTVHPSWSITEVNVARRQKEREEERRKNRRRCVICDTLFWAGKGKEKRHTCGGECSEIYQLLFRDLHEARREGQRVSVAKWWLANHTPEDDPEQWRHHQRMIKVDGKSDKVNSQGFWFIEGSRTFEAACRLYELGGRAFEDLKPQKQKQIKEYMQAKAREEDDE